jgi:hypothetical protein
VGRPAGGSSPSRSAAFYWRVAPPAHCALPTAGSERSENFVTGRYEPLNHYFSGTSPFSPPRRVTSRSSQLGDIPFNPGSPSADPSADPRLDFTYSAAISERNPPFPAGSSKRMKGLEPSTFCMASRAEDNDA